MEEKVLLLLAQLQSQSFKKKPIISQHHLPLLYEDENVNGRKSGVQSAINKNVAHLLSVIKRSATLHGLSRRACWIRILITPSVPLGSSERDPKKGDTDGA